MLILHLRFGHVAIAALVAVLYLTSSGERALDTTPSDWSLPANVSVADVSARAPSRARPLVAVVGLSRTGTSSVAAALEMLNMSVYHTQHTVEHHLDFWSHYLAGRISRPDVHKLLDSPRVDAVADVWYALLAPEIVRAYPDAKFILTTRDVSAWIRSYDKYYASSHLYHWGRQAHRLLLSAISRTLRVGPVLRAVGVVQPAGGFELEKLPHLRYIWRRSDELVYGDPDPTGGRARWADDFARHSAFIKSIVPKENLLEFDVTRGHGWKELLEFVRVPAREASRVTSRPFPHAFAAGTVAAGGASMRSYSATRVHEACVAALVLGALLALCARSGGGGGGAAARRRGGRAPSAPALTRDAHGFEFHLVREEDARPPPSALQSLAHAWADFKLRAWVWWRLFGEYAQMKATYEAHRRDGFFDYGEPGAFDALLDHPATKQLLKYRVGRHATDSVGGGGGGGGAGGGGGGGGAGGANGGGAGASGGGAGANGHAGGANGNGAAAPPESTPTAALLERLGVQSPLPRKESPGASAAAPAPPAAPAGQGLHSTLGFDDDGSVLPTYLPVEHGAGAALGALALAAADLFELRTGEAQQVRVSRADSGLATGAYLFLKVAPSVGAYEGCDGFASTIEQEGKVNPVRKAYTCADGRSVFLHGGFPKLKQGILDFFGGCEPKVGPIAAGCARWDGAELERAMQAKGLAATLCRTPGEWRASEQGKAVLASPLIDIDVRHTPTPGGARLLPTGLSVTRPLSDVLVLDFSHVIASPVVGRSLVDHGATVIKIVTHARPRRHLFDEEANAGKLSYELNLETDAGKARLWALLRAADVLIDGYTDGVLARHGFAIDDVLGVCPHLVYCQVACYGFDGPFAGRKGFQQNANFCAGVAALEDEALLGYQLVSQIDYATGFLGAYGVVLALCHRQLAAQRGEMLRGLRVRVSLCGTATWMAQFGAACPGWAEYVFRITRLIWFSAHRTVTAGNLTHLPPPVAMTATPPVRVPGFNRWWRSAKQFKL